jgi:hypothetical protein
MTPKIYKLPLSPNYVCDWTAASGFRELIQNACDREDVLDYEWSSSEEELHSLRITTSNVQLSQSLLLMGSSSKEDGDSSRGMYGEGMKLSFLTLLREGLKVSCYNGNKLWTPYFEICEDFDAMMLHVGEVSNEGGKDLTYVVYGISSELKEEVISNTLQMQGDYEKTDTSIGSILKGLDHAGRVFVGGLFVCRHQLDMGYDFKPEVMKLNRDRANIDGWDLKRETQKMHCEKTPPKEVAQMICDQKRDLNYVQYHSAAVPEEVVEEVFKLHVKLNGDVPLADNFYELKRMKKEGYKDAVLLGNEGMTKLVKMSHNYKPKPSEIVLTPAEILVQYYDNFEGEMSNFAIEEFDKIIKLAKDWEG